jgi:hypothetical protein
MLAIRSAAKNAGNGEVLRSLVALPLIARQRVLQRCK